MIRATFNAPWRALRQYNRVSRAFTEDVWLENNVNNPFGIDYGTPVAESRIFEACAPLPQAAEP